MEKDKYQPRKLACSFLFTLVRDNYDYAKKNWAVEYSGKYGQWRETPGKEIHKYFDCSNPVKGFAKFKCDYCGKVIAVPFSCKSRICPSCNYKKTISRIDWLTKEVLFDLRHRHWVFTLPPCVRDFFLHKRYLLPRLSTLAAKILIKEMKKRCPDKTARPGIITFIQTAGETLNWNPHIHSLATMGCFTEKFRYYNVDFIPYKVIARKWQVEVLKLLIKCRCITREEAIIIYKKYRNGFNVNGEITDTFTDMETINRLSGYVMRLPISESRIVDYDKETYKVIFLIKTRDCRGGLARPNPKLKYDKSPRKTEQYEMDSREFTARLVMHIPNRSQKTISYYGLYSNRTRNRWRKLGMKPKKISQKLKRSELKSRWVEYLWKVFNINPLKCSNCGKEMKLAGLVLTDCERQYKEILETNRFLYPP